MESINIKKIIEGRYGISPDEDMKHGRQMFVDYVNKAAEKDPWLKENKPKVEWFGPYWDSAKIDIDHPIVKTSINAYKEVFEDGQWDWLIELFTKESYHLHSITKNPQLLTCLNIGVSILKTVF